MIKIQAFSRSQRRKTRRKLIAAMCISLATCGYDMYGKPITMSVGNKTYTIVGCSTASAATRNDNPLVTEGQYEDINIGELPINEENIRICDINTSGVYLLRGSNIDEEQGVYIPTQIIIEEGVNAVVYMDNLEIWNKDGVETPSTGVVNQDATLPMIVNGNCTIKLLNNALLKVNTSNAAMQVNRNGKVTLSNTDNQLTLGIEDCFSYYGERVLKLSGSFIMEGSHLKIDGVDIAIDFGDVVSHIDGYYKEGKMIIHNGYFETNGLYDMPAYDNSPCFSIDGGQFSRNFINENAVERLGTSRQCIANISKLPANTHVDTVELYDTQTGELRYLNTTNMTVDEMGNLNINIINPEGRDRTKLGLIIQCGSTFFKVTYDKYVKEINTLTLSLHMLANTDVYTIHYMDMDGNLLKTVYTEVDAEHKAVLQMRNDTNYNMSYYLTPSLDGEVFDGTLSSYETNVYVTRDTRKYNVAITGDQVNNLEMEAGTQLPDEYYYVTEDNEIVQKVNQDCSLTAYKKVNVNGVEYFDIDSESDLSQFRDLVNNGYNTLNGYLETNIDTSENWLGIGIIKDFVINDSHITLDNSYKGIFEGNAHTVTLHIVETDRNKYRNFFGIIGQGAVIRNLYTTGTITTKGFQNGGIVGQAKDSCTIMNCGSNVVISYNGYSDLRTGGILGEAISSNVTIKNCYYSGKISSQNQKVGAVGGIVGYHNYSILTVSHCFVDAEYEFNQVSGYNICYEGNNYGTTQVNDCYYVTALGDSAQGTNISKEELASSEFAYQLNDDGCSEAWAYRKGDAYPVLALDGLYPAHKVTFTSSDTIYETNFETSYGYTYSDGTVSLPDMSTCLQENDQPVWSTSYGMLTQDSVIPNDCVATFTVNYNRENVLSLLSAAYNTEIAQDTYTASSVTAYQQVKDQVGSILEEDDGYTTEQLIGYIGSIRQAKANLVVKTGGGNNPGIGDNSGQQGSEVSGDKTDSQEKDAKKDNTSLNEDKPIDINIDTTYKSGKQVVVKADINTEESTDKSGGKTEININGSDLAKGLEKVDLSKTTQVSVILKANDALAIDNLAYNLDQDTIKLLDKNKLGITVKVNDNLGKPEAIIYVPAQQLGSFAKGHSDLSIGFKSNNLSDISMEKEKTRIEKTIKSNNGKPDNTIIITSIANPEYKGGMTIATPIAGAKKGDFRFVYEYNKYTHKLVETPNGKKTVSKDGTISIQTVPGVEYVISETQLEGKYVTPLINQVKIEPVKEVGVSDTIKIGVDTGKSIQIVPKFTKGDPYLKEEAVVTYKVDQPKLAFISADGTLKAKGKGTVTIHVTITLENKDKKTFTTKVTIK